MTRDGMTIVHALVGRKAAGESIPVVRLIPSMRTGRLTVIVRPARQGGAGDARRRSRPRWCRRCWTAARASSASTRCSSASRSTRRRPARHRPGTSHFDTYNPSLAADQVQDLATVLAWARTQPDVREVSLIGAGRSGPQVLLARPALEGVARTAIDLHELRLRRRLRPVSRRRSTCRASSSSAA